MLLHQKWPTCAPHVRPSSRDGRSSSPILWSGYRSSALPSSPCRDPASLVRRLGLGYLLTDKSFAMEIGWFRRGRRDLLYYVVVGPTARPSNSPRRAVTRNQRPLAVFGAVVFALAFGHVEAVVVAYIRLASTGTIDGGVATGQIAAAQFPWWIEITREAATIVMLVGVAVAIGRALWERLGFFLLTFALWDAQYYFSLRLLTGWPPALDTPDVYFLIPVPWIGPVWLPLVLDALALGLTSPLWWSRRRGR